MAQLQTRPHDGDVQEFLATVENDGRRVDAQALCELMTELTGEPAQMWGPAIVGFGSRQLKYASGREIDWPKIGFSPRKQNLTIYLMDGFEDYTDELSRLGKHTIGKSCLYIKRLSDVDQSVLAELITASYAHADD